MAAPGWSEQLKQQSQAVTVDGAIAILEQVRERRKAMDRLRQDKDKKAFVLFTYQLSQAIGAPDTGEEFSESFLAGDGLNALLNAMASCHAQQAEILRVVRPLLPYQNAIDQLTESRALVDRLYGLLRHDSDGEADFKWQKKAKEVLEILIVTVGATEKGHELVHECACQVSQGEKPYAAIIPVLKAQDINTITNGLAFLNILATKRLKVGAKEELVKLWERCGLLKVMKCLTQLESVEVRNQLTVFQKLTGHIIPLGEYAARDMERRAQELARKAEESKKDLGQFISTLPRAAVIDGELSRVEETLGELQQLIAGLTDAEVQKLLDDSKKWAQISGTTVSDQYRVKAFRDIALTPQFKDKMMEAAKEALGQEASWSKMQKAGRQLDGDDLDFDDDSDAPSSDDEQERRRREKVLQQLRKEHLERPDDFDAPSASSSEPPPPDSDSDEPGPPPDDFDEDEPPPPDGDADGYPPGEAGGPGGGIGGPGGAGGAAAAGAQPGVAGTTHADPAAAAADAAGGAAAAPGAPPSVTSKGPPPPPAAPGGVKAPPPPKAATKPAGKPGGKKPGAKRGKGPPPLDLEFFKGPKPQKKMKVVHWDKYVLTTDPHRTLWHRVHPHPEVGGDLDCSFDYEQLETLFSEKVKSDKKKDKKEKKEVITLIEGKKFQNLSIMLHKMPPLEQVERAVQTLDVAALDREKLEMLLAGVPTDEDAEEFRGNMHKKPREEYEPPEKFFDMVLNSLEFTKRCKAWIFTLEWDENVESALKPIRKLQAASDAILTSQHLPYVMGIILGFGNILNHGHAQRGSAGAFGHATLSKLEMTKDQSGKVNLMQHLINTCRDRRPESLELAKELDPCMQGVQAIKFDEIDKGVTGLEAALRKFKAQVKQVRDKLAAAGLADSDPFGPRMVEFHSKAEAEYAAVEKEAQRVKETFTKVLEYWAAPPKALKKPEPDEFFAHFCPFLEKFGKGASDILKEKERAAKKGKKIQAKKGKGDDDVEKLAAGIKEQLISAD
eukprot:TRINITY_DN4493_c0_g1_i1.p1 TRINITY_DN4493_c0_g1~~TRINITY_DN4493_c0_g1_i1.p1  ORF type:complete len:1009 (+),score=362.05 TRINITY_DN4493_c0_g1_i1:88-3114(+)